MPEPTTTPPPLTEDQLIALCAQKLGTVQAIDNNIANRKRQDEADVANRAKLVAEIAAIKAAIKAGAAYVAPAK